MNVFQYAYTTEENWKRNLEDMTSWRPKYTFYSDFGIAEYCEVWMHDAGAIKNTFKNVIESWASSYEALTEIVMVLNHKCWSFSDGVDSHYLNCGETNRVAICELYGKLYEKAVAEFEKRFSTNNEAMAYYYEITD